MRQRPSLRDAVVLGAVQGPTELLPVSSSAHIALLARGAGGSDAELQDALEVALHAGTALALLVAGRRELVRAARELDGPRLVAGVLALVPPALLGYLLERGPARRPATPRTIAVGLALGGAAMVWADTRPQVRTLAQAGAGDGLALGLAQAAALFPGVSRNGATLTVARARGFARADAQALSWRVGVPVMVGAAALKGTRLMQAGVPPKAARTLAAGAGAALISTLAGAPLIAPARRGRALLPFGLYRMALALLANRLRTAHNRS
ncbi:MAG TPA: undecaprenyl-diphosphate phosphatase [Solirubrobacteraceae bacterium]|jgi:undecaprenyl-diphosphatase